jgi:hypothetical protein
MIINHLKMGVEPTGQTLYISNTPMKMNNVQHIIGTMNQPL